MIVLSMFYGFAQWKTQISFRVILRISLALTSPMVIIEQLQLSTLENCEERKLNKKVNRLLERSHSISSWLFTIQRVI